MAASIPLFVSLEMVFIDTFCLFGLLATAWHLALIAIVWIVAVIYLSMKIGAAMKPGAGADENVRTKPFWTVVACRSAVIRGGFKVAVRTIRGYPDANGDLSLRFGHCCCEAASCNSSEH